MLLGSLWCALRVVAFIRGCWVHSGMPWRSFGSSWVARITQVRPGYRWIQSFSLLRCALGVFGFIRFRLVHSGATWGALGACVSLGSSEVVVFTRVCHGGRWVNTGYLGSVPRALGVFRVRLVHSGAPWVRLVHARRWVHPRSLGSLGCAMGFVGFMRGRWVHASAPCWALSSCGVVRFIRGGTRVRPEGRWVHPVSLGSHGCALGVVGFILGR